MSFRTEGPTHDMRGGHELGRDGARSDRSRDDSFKYGGEEQRSQRNGSLK
jgi:hypothetical protein